MRDVGLIASEGRMTIPMADGTPSGVLDVTSHVFEFIPEEEGDSPNPTVLAAHELQEGRTYYVLMMTAFGLYRCNIFDVVRCTGFHNRTPLVEFLSKGCLLRQHHGRKGLRAPRHRRHGRSHGRPQTWSLTAYYTVRAVLGRRDAVLWPVCRTR